MDRCYFGCIRVLTRKRMGAVLFMWHVRRLEIPPRLKYKCTAPLVTRTGSLKKIECGSSGSRVVVGYACLLLSSAFGWKKLVVLANSTPVATWTLSSWRDFRNKFHGFSTLFVAYNVCSVVFCLCLFVLSRLIVFVLYFVNACTFYVWDFSWSFVTHFFYHTIVNLCLYYTVCNVVTEANGIVFKFYGRRKYCN